MKRIDIILAVAAILITGIVLKACKDPGEGVTINVNTYVLKAPTAVQFVNAVRDAPNQPGDFPVTIGGRDAALVVTSDNKTTFNAKKGMIMLALKKGVIPSETSPIIFTVAAEIPGYTPATQTFKITSDEAISVRVPVIEYANPVAGTAALVKEDALVGGATVVPITIETPSNPNMQEQTTISVAAGTQFLDANGNVINATKLESRIVQYGTETQEALAAFPGGFNPTNVIGENGQPIEGGVAFVTAGFIAIDMYAGGTEVKRFSKPLEIKMEVNEARVNPETGVAVKAGDKVPVWSLNDKTGQWEFEANATLVADAVGKLSASFEASHLSYWNFDWSSTLCPRPLQVNFIASDIVSQEFQIYVRATDGYSSWSYFTVKNNRLSVTQALPNKRVQIAVYDLYGTLMVETGFFNACSQGTIDVTIPPKSSIDLVKVNLALQGECPNKPVNENVSSWVTILEKGKSRANAFAVYVRDGKVNLTLKNNVEYTVEAYYGDRIRTTSILFTKTDFSFPGNINGVATYDQSSNTVNVAAKFPLPNCQ